jgi:hypothetical protein
MKWIEEKMKLLGVSTHNDYKVVFYLDDLAMISIFTPKYGVVQVSYVSNFIIHKDQSLQLTSHFHLY